VRREAERGSDLTNAPRPIHENQRIRSDCSVLASATPA
jgi:hypothetical protein